MAKKNNQTTYYLIHVKSGKVIESSTNKSALRRKLKEQKNPQMYKVSKFDKLVESKPKAKKDLKKTKKSTGKAKKAKAPKKAKAKKAKKTKKADAALDI